MKILNRRSPALPYTAMKMSSYGVPDGLPTVVPGVVCRTFVCVHRGTQPYGRVANLARLWRVEENIGLIHVEL